jgi:hypothetical protein
VAPEQDEGSKSKRPFQTISPLAQELNVAPVLDFGKGQEDALAKQVLAQSSVVLISWQHEAIVKISPGTSSRATNRLTICRRRAMLSWLVANAARCPPSYRVVGRLHRRNSAPRKGDQARLPHAGEANIMMRIPAAIGVCALMLLGSALSACANGGNKGGPAATNNAVCQPGVCLV